MKIVDRILTILTWFLGVFLIFILTAPNEHIENLSVVFVCAVGVYFVVACVLLWILKKKVKMSSYKVVNLFGED